MLYRSALVCVSIPTRGSLLLQDRSPLSGMTEKHPVFQSPLGEACFYRREAWNATFPWGSGHTRVSIPTRGSLLLQDVSKEK